MLKKLLLIIVAAAIAISSAAYWAVENVRGYVNTSVLVETSTLFTVPKGAHYNKVVELLEQQGIVSPSSWSKWAPKLYPELTRIQAGTFQITPAQSLQDVFAQLRSGKQHQLYITFIEGSTFKQWLAALSREEHLKPTLKGKTEAEIAQLLGSSSAKLEGLLLPETYSFDVGDSDFSVLQRAYNNMQKALNQAWQKRETSLPINSEYELLTLASIIEKETAVDGERAKVASVFVNRLNKGMRLQTDPTVIYGMGDEYNGNIRKKDLRAPTPYNTYVIKGLPPTPIAMPGVASINAAANPATTRYFYFVADGKGGHTFSKTLAEHNRAVRQYLKILKSQ